MNWTIVANTALGFLMTGLGFLIRRLMRKYERALVAAEAARRIAATSELAELKALVKELNVAVSKVTQEQAAMKTFLTGWASKLTGEVGKIFKMSQKDVDELRELLDGLIKFMGAAKDSPDENSVKQIGEDLWLVHKKKENIR